MIKKNFIGVMTPCVAAALFMSGIMFTGCSKDEDFEDWDEETVQTLAEQRMTRSAEGTVLYIAAGSASSEDIEIIKDHLYVTIHATWGKGCASFITPAISFTSSSRDYIDYINNKRIEYELGVCSASNVGIHLNSIVGNYHISYDVYYYPKISSYDYSRREHKDIYGSFEIKNAVKYISESKQ